MQLPWRYRGGAPHHGEQIGFLPARSVHHAIRTVKLQLQDGDEQSTAGRWVIEGDLASYFDTVHHRLLLKGVRKRIADHRFVVLLWKFIKAGCVDCGRRSDHVLIRPE